MAGIFRDNHSKRLIFVLGCDWLQSVRPAVFNGRLLSPSIDAVTILGVGHEWFSHPKGQCACIASSR
ncbi:hypothetical protein DFH29DRAFT_1001687 [Suillus ampliporus]|nr:hypothetical protein DFH29DRAFT_1001687 [Suillus ampliporus]